MPGAHTPRPTAPIAAVPEAARQPNAASASINTIPALDGIRGIAVLLVIWCHLEIAATGAGMARPAFLAWVGPQQGWGVYLFFALSGFLLFRPYARAMVGGERWPSAVRFYQRRGLRILPAYYAALIVGLVLAGAMPTLPDLAACLALLHDWRPGAWQTIMAADRPLWSLAVEWQFYLVLPWLALALSRLRTPRRIALGLGAVVLFGLAVRAGAAFDHYQLGNDLLPGAPGILGFAAALLYGVKGRYLELFALGMLVSLFYTVRIESGRLAPAITARVGRWGLVCALLIVYVVIMWSLHVQFLYPHPHTFDPWVWPGDVSWAIFGEWLLGVASCGLLLSALCGPAALRRAWSWGPLRRVGHISYSLYVWHEIVLRLLLPVGAAFGAWAYPAYTFVVVLALLVVGSLSYRYIERPFLRWRRATTARPRAADVAASAR